jgi:hyaluronan synthase
MEKNVTLVQAKQNNLESIFKLSIFMFVTLIVFLAIFTGAFERASYLYNFRLPTRYLRLPLFFYAFMVLIHLPYRAIFTFRYKPYPIREDNLPKVSVVIPAFNEGKMVEYSIISAVQASYPRSKLEIICIDDGSADDTWNYMERLKLRYPKLVKTIRFKKNQGKRAALAAGFHRAKGDIIATMDSDTVMEENAIKAIVSPFNDEKVGATTAKVRVFNSKDNLLTRMLGVRYAMAFEFFRASRSTFKTVMCCSGVLSAYRRKIIMNILPQWLNQEFLGQKCTYGDDRSLTNFVLRSGYDTIYQKNAIVYTTVPNNLTKLAKMLTRWHKSFIRENYIFATFMFSNYRTKNKLLPIFDFFLSSLLIPFQFYMVFFTMYYIFIDPLLILRFLALISIMGSIYMMLYIKFEKNTDFVYGLLYSYLHIFFLMWTIPYAIITFRNNSWLTR